MRFFGIEQKDGMVRVPGPVELPQLEVDISQLPDTVVYTDEVQTLTNKTIDTAQNDITVAQSDVTGLTLALSLKLDAASYTAADVLTKLLTVDGSGSGLDADLLDGVSSAGFFQTGSALLAIDAAYSFAADTDTFYGRSSSNVLGMTVGGTETVRVSSGGIDVRGAVPFFRLTETDAATDEGVWRSDLNSRVLRIRAYNDDLSLNAIALAITRGTGATPNFTNIAVGNATDNPTYSFLGTGTATFSGQATALRFVPSSSTAGTNSFYLSAANTPAVSSNSALAMSWDASQNTLGKAAIRSDSATGGVGYATGAGGTVTQTTSRTTGVTLNKVCGAITLVSAAGSATYATFTVTNSAVAATDVVHVCQKSGTDKYQLHVTAVAAGSFDITFATTGGTTTEQPVFNFAVIKAVAA